MQIEHGIGELVSHRAHSLALGAAGGLMVQSLGFKVLGFGVLRGWGLQS